MLMMLPLASIKNLISLESISYQALSKGLIFFPNIKFLKGYKGKWVGVHWESS